MREQNLDVRLAAVAPVTVEADRLALSRALRNLLINAATHGMSASVRVENPEPATARVTIEDRGPGIPRAVMGRVFEPFFHVDRARSQTIPGAGLGLTIAREIIQLCGGSITVCNGTDRGLVQTVELPAA